MDGVVTEPRLMSRVETLSGLCTTWFSELSMRALAAGGHSAFGQPVAVLTDQRRSDRPRLRLRQRPLQSQRHSLAGEHSGSSRQQPAS